MLCNAVQVLASQKQMEAKYKQAQSTAVREACKTTNAIERHLMATRAAMRLGFGLDVLTVMQVPGAVLLVGKWQSKQLCTRVCARTHAHAHAVCTRHDDMHLHCCFCCRTTG